MLGESDSYQSGIGYINERDDEKEIAHVVHLASRELLEIAEGGVRRKVGKAVRTVVLDVVFAMCVARVLASIRLENMVWL